MPFDQFVSWQLAGDELAPDNPLANECGFAHEGGRVEIPFTIEGALQVYTILHDARDGEWRKLGFRTSGYEAYLESMRGLWENGRLPNVERWFARIEARPSFNKCLINWVPEDLANDLRENGAKSWPEVARILEIDI